MRKQAICIQCHTNPEIVNFLIKSLPGNRFDFYIHIDKKADIIDEILKKENVYFADSIDVRWGRFSQVKATLSIFKMIDVKKYSYIHFASGNCFIAKSPEVFYDFFNNSDKEYIESKKIGKDSDSTWSCRGEDRYSCYYPQWIIHRPSRKVWRMIRVCYREFVMRTKIFKRKKFPVDSFYGGSGWFSITGNALDWMMKYLDEHKEYYNYFKHGV